MVSNAGRTVDEYIATLPVDRQSAIAEVRGVIRRNLPPGFEEAMMYGMIGYCIPLSRYPDTYNGQPLGIVGLASQKGYMSLYLMAVYADPALRRWFEAECKKAGKKLDMGKSCVRFKSVEDLPLDLIGAVVARVGVDDLIARYEAARPKRTARTASAKKRTRGRH